MAQMPQISVRVVDGELLEMLVTLLEDISKIDLEELKASVAFDDKAENEFFKIENIYLYARAATERFAEIKDEIQAKVTSIEIHLTDSKK